MGIEPFTLPKRNPPTPDKLPESASRQERVNALAQLLHSRGLTSSMSDARRLAEGMVDVEKKVVKQATATAAAQQTHSSTDMADAVPRQAQKQTFNLSLPESFSHFVAQAAAMSHEETKPSVAIQPSAKQQVTFGREEQRVVAEVPHVHARKQVFFEDAPPITAARGYKGPQPQQVDFSTQRQEFLNAQAKRAEQKAEQVTQKEVRVSTGDGGVAVTRVESGPNVQVVEETVIVQEPASSAPATAAPVHEAEPAPQIQVISEPVAEPVEMKAEPEKTIEQPPEPKAEPAPKEDLAKRHGVDLFEMFKKK